MNHLPPLISDLALILMTAAVVTVLFQKLRQPLVLGYLLAGVLVGNSVSFLPNISDSDSIHVWAEIGVIFLLFGLGLEFSFSKIAHYGRSAGITASVEVIFMLGLGFLTGRALGWGTADCLFLGGILSISSTSIIVRAFEEMKLKTKSFAQFVFGVLVFEDLLAILILVAFSALGASRGQSSLGWLSIIPFLIFFLVLSFTLGVYLVPQIFQRWKKELNDETVLIFSLGLCLMLVVLATKSGFSAALGAFLMGSIIGGTNQAHRIERLLMPIKDLFAAIFFVSVGMMINPAYLLQYWGSILVILSVTILGKTFSTCVGAVLSGQGPRDSIRSGLSLAQIGEFSFIIASLGLSLKLTSEFLYPITVAVAVITTFTTPYLIRWSNPIANWLERRLGESFLQGIDNYRQAVNTSSRSNLKSLIWHAVGFAPIVNSVLIVAMTLAVRHWILPTFGEWIPAEIRSYAFAVATLILVAPFFWGILQARVHAEDTEESIDLRAIFFGILLARAFLTLFLAFFVLGTFISDSIVSLVLISLVFLGLIFGRRWLEPAYRRMETKFLKNLLADHQKPSADNPPKMKLTPWDAQLKKVTISADSPLAAKTLLDANLRDQYGVMVTLIGRGSKQIMTPGRDEILLPGDVLYLIGNEEQIEKARADLEFQSPEPFQDLNIGLSPLRLGKLSPFLQKSIRASGLRESTQGLIVGMEREGSRILNPDSNLELREGDLLWIVGRRDLIQSLSENKGL